MKENVSMVHPSSPTITRSSNVSSSLVWAQQSIPSGAIATSIGTSPSAIAYNGQGGNVVHQHAPSNQRHPFQQQAYTIVDPNLGISQSQRMPISQSPHNLLYNSQSRNVNMPYPPALERSGK